LEYAGNEAKSTRGKVGGLHREFLKSTKPASFGYRAILADAVQSFEDYVSRDALVNGSIVPTTLRSA
jgi:hypothetical protein